MAKLGDTFKLFGEFVRFARDNKAYWIIPLVIFFGITALVIVAGHTAAPLLYTLF